MGLILVYIKKKTRREKSVKRNEVSWLGPKIYVGQLILGNPSTMFFSCKVFKPLKLK